MAVFFRNWGILIVVIENFRKFTSFLYHTSIKLPLKHRHRPKILNLQKSPFPLQTDLLRGVGGSFLVKSGLLHTLLRRCLLGLTSSFPIFERRYGLCRDYLLPWEIRDNACAKQNWQNFNFFFPLSQSLFNCFIKANSLFKETLPWFLPVVSTYTVTLLILFTITTASITKIRRKNRLAFCSLSKSWLVI
jgi:hypothetical protein